MKPILITGPAEDAVSLAEIKAHAVVGFDDDNAVLSGFLSAAIAHLDGYTGILGRCLVTQEWAQDYCAWADNLLLPFPDVSTASITYTDASGDSQTVPAGQYEILDGHLGSRIVFRTSFSWPDLSDDVTQPIRVQFTAGYGAASAVPWPLKVAIMQLAAHWYENRRATGSAKSLPYAFDDLIRPYRLVGP